jgi:uncharacterized protein (DUF4415 family)
MKPASTRKPSKTNWKRIDSQSDSQINYQEIPPLSAEFFSSAIRWPGHKQQITLRIDPDVLAFFKRHGKGYQTTINAVLRKYVEVSKQRRSGH